MRLLISGGGTAGHIYPLLAVLDEVKKKLCDERMEILYIGSKGGIEEEILKKENIPSFFIFSGKWRRYWFKWLPALLFNIKDLFLIIAGFFQAFFIMAKFHPDILLAKGGYVTVPVVFAAKICGIPIISHESDIVMGVSNKISAKMSEKICVSFPIRYYPNLPKDKLVYTGNPVRKEFFTRSRLSKKNKPMVLVMGGSQGAEIINKIILKMIPKIIKNINIVHITGKSKAEAAFLLRRKLPKEDQKNYEIFEFIDNDLAKIMMQSDLILSRAGANTLAEISVCGKPSILIPLKNAASDHQTKNAQIFAQNNAAVIILEDNLNVENLQDTILKLIDDKEKLKKMSENSFALAKKDAASLIAEEVIKQRE